MTTTRWATQTPSKPKGRVVAIDRLRGLVIALMALDHARGFFAAGPGPEALDTTTAPYFLTRWVTHFCAPVFVLLAGTGARLHADKANDDGATARWLLTRGLWLMFLEVTWITASWFFAWQTIHLGVVWAIGGAMVLLSGCVGWPGKAMAIVGIVITLLLAAVAVPGDWMFGWLFQPGGLNWFGKPVSNVYVIVPWFAVMAIGWGIAPALADRSRDRHLVLVGVGLTLAFAALRWLNGCGDPRPWGEHERGAMVTAFAFLSPSKYPPSLLFLLMTLGPALLAIPVLRRARGRLGAVLETFGKVPLFFYLLHIPMYHAGAILYARVVHDSGENASLSLPVIWGAWLAGLLVLLPLCSWWNGVKRRRRFWWVAYL